MTDQPEGRLLAGAAHELAGAELADRLGQAAFELIAFRLPLRMFQTRLERQGGSRQTDEQADKQAGQEEMALAHRKAPRKNGVPLWYRSRRQKLEGTICTA